MNMKELRAPRKEEGRVWARRGFRCYIDRTDNIMASNSFACYRGFAFSLCDNLKKRIKMIHSHFAHESRNKDRPGSTNSDLLNPLLDNFARQHPGRLQYVQVPKFLAQSDVLASRTETYRHIFSVFLRWIAFFFVGSKPEAYKTTCPMIYITEENCQTSR